MTRTDPAAPPATLRRTLGLTSGIMVTVGSVIGSGIFLKPFTIALALPDPTWILGLWAAIGVVCLLGAFAYAELGAMLPEAGGQYAFLREAWGPFPAFLYGWCLLLVINTGTLAALAWAFADNLDSLAGLSETGSYLVAAAMIVVLAAVNHIGVGWGAAVQNVSTFAKLAALAAIAVAGAFAGGRSGEGAAAAVASELPPSPEFVSGLVAAAVAIFWAYEGWYQLPFNAAELKNPRRDLPWGLILGLAILVAIYLAVNAIYLKIVPVDEMRSLATNIDVPKTAVTRIFGGTAAESLVVLISISVLGAANPNLLSTPRGIYAMAQDGLVPRAFMRIHPRFGTPAVAIWFQAAWAIALLFYGKFDALTAYVVFAALLFYALTVAGVYVLRNRRPDADRPFRCWGYPLTPAVFVLAVLFVDWQTLLDPTERENAIYGLAIIASGVPFYFLARKFLRPASS